MLFIFSPNTLCNCISLNLIFNSMEYNFHNSFHLLKELTLISLLEVGHTTSALEVAVRMELQEPQRSLGGIGGAGRRLCEDRGGERRDEEGECERGHAFRLACRRSKQQRRRSPCRLARRGPQAASAQCLPPHRRQFRRFRRLCRPRPAPISRHMHTRARSFTATTRCSKARLCSL